MKGLRTVSLLTDFGLLDPYVGILKAVMLREEPTLSLVDLTHSVPAQDIPLAELWLASSYAWFAPDSVHLCVVDPGVGTERAALVVRAHGHYFVAPDNGVLSSVLRSDPHAEARHIEAQRLGLTLRSRTFHGRDVFAPVAARIASGRLDFAEVGPSCEPLLSADRPATRSIGELVGRVVAVDNFGNLITNLPGAWLGPAHVWVEVAGQTLRRVRTYADADVGECVALISSFDTLEIAARNDHAANLLGVSRDARVRVARNEGGS